MAKYPDIRAGQRLDAPLLTSMLSETIVKDADETISNSTTFQDDNDLFVALEANARYRIEFELSAISVQSGGTFAGIKTSWSVPSGVSGLKHCIGPVGNDRDASLGRFSVHFPTTSVSYGVESATLASAIREVAIITTTSAGTLRLQWAQNTAVVGNTGMAAGSHLVVGRIG